MSLKGGFWHANGYPERFVVEGIEFTLRKETAWSRRFSSNSTDEHLRNVMVSRFMDGSADIKIGKTRLKNLVLSPEERHEIEVCLQVVGEKI